MITFNLVLTLQICHQLERELADWREMFGVEGKVRGGSLSGMFWLKSSKGMPERRFNGGQG